MVFISSEELLLKLLSLPTSFIKKNNPQLAELHGIAVNSSFLNSDRYNIYAGLY